jgi:HK97 family phage major capsid protein/HK97 family phage prohead protease
MKHIYRREAQVERQAGSSDVFPCVISSNAPVSRGDFMEVLSHAPDSVDMSRAPLPLIESHDSGKLNIGVIEDLKLVGGKLRGMLRLGKSARAQEIKSDIQEGIVGALSVGYRWIKWSDKNDTVTVTRWQPLEVSLVAIPADINAGIFRNLNLNMEQQMELDDIMEETALSRGQRRAQRNESSSHQLGAEAERGRIRELEGLGKIHRISEDLVRRWVDSGVSTEGAREAALEIILARGAQPSNHDFSGGSPYEYAGSGSQDYGFGRQEMQNFSICRAVAACISKDFKDAGLERSMSSAIAQKLGRSSEGFFLPVNLPMSRGQNPASTRAYSVGGSGGNLVETQLLASSFIEMLRNQAQVMQLGATFLTGLVGNVDIPRRATSSTTYWVGESGNVTNSTGSLEKISLTPKTVGSLSTFTRKMILQSSPEIEMLIRKEFVENIALAIDMAALSGLGSSNQPLGIFNTSGIGSVVGGTNGGQVTIDMLMDMAAAVANANATGANLGYLVNTKTQAALSKQKASGSGEYLWARAGEMTSVAERLVDRINGNPILVSNQLPNSGTKGTGTNLSSLIYGNWSDLIIGEWGTLEILVNPYSPGFANGDVDIRVLQSVDIGVRHAASFAVVTDAITA